MMSFSVGLGSFLVKGYLRRIGRVSGVPDLEFTPLWVLDVRLESAVIL